MDIAHILERHWDREAVNASAQNLRDEVVQRSVAHMLDGKSTREVLAIVFDLGSALTDAVAILCDFEEGDHIGHTFLGIAERRQHSFVLLELRIELPCTCGEKKFLAELSGQLKQKVEVLVNVEGGHGGRKQGAQERLVTQVRFMRSFWITSLVSVWSA